MTDHPVSTLRWTYLSSWVIYAAVVAYVDWSKSDTYGLVLGGFGIIGTVVAVSTVKSTKWSLISLWLSIILIALYFGRWADQIAYRYAADPSPGLLRDVLLQAEMWGAMVNARLAQDRYLDALVEAYWLFGMVLLQCLFVLMALIRRSSTPMADNEQAVKSR